MEFFISEKEKTGLNCDDNSAFIDVNDFFDLKNLGDFKEIIRYQIFNSGILNKYGLDDSFLNSIYKYAIFEKTFDSLEREFNKNYVISFDMLKNTIDSYRYKYLKLLNAKIDHVTIICDKNSFLKALAYSKYIRLGNITLFGTDIKLADYYKLLDGVKLKNYERQNIKVLLSDSLSPISLSKVYELSCILKEKADKIDELKLSQLEKILYAYDIVKKRIYRDNEEDKYLSRDIDKVINGDYTVCLGYARILNELLEFLDIKSKVIISSQKKHARNLIYVDDKKYDVNGFLVFDPTFDSRKDISDTEYVNKYNYFGVPTLISYSRIPIEELKNIYKSFDRFADFIQYSSFDKVKNIGITFEELCDMMGYSDGTEFFYKIMEFGLLSERDKKKVKERYNEIVNKLYNTELSMDSFIEILYNARRGEYYHDGVESIDREAIKRSTLVRNYSINRMRLGKIDELEKLILNFNYNENKDYLNAHSEDIISRSLESGVSTDKDILDLQLLKVLKRRLTSIEK